MGGSVTNLFQIPGFPRQMTTGGLSRAKKWLQCEKTEDDRKELVKKVLDKNEDLEKKRNEVNINNLKSIKEKSTKKKKK